MWGKGFCLRANIASSVFITALAGSSEETHLKIDLLLYHSNPHNNRSEQKASPWVISQLAMRGGPPTLFWPGLEALIDSAILEYFVGAEGGDM